MAGRNRVGLGFWMTTVLEDCVRVGRDLDPDAVHDLRVALRRCRSVADGFMKLDPHASWRAMRKEARRLFDHFGELRDAQVLSAWVRSLGTPGEETTSALSGHFERQERRLRADAAETLRSFDARKWLGWTAVLAARGRMVAPGSLAFRNLALERWLEARQLHHRALRDRSHVAFHRLRIGLKRFRYTIENFLPDHIGEWGPGLRELQDLVGEAHDLTLLWQIGYKIGAFQDHEVRARWRQLIDQERTRRLDAYRRTMCGRNSLWHVWRAGLPQGYRIRSSAVARLSAWAAYRDPEFAHARHVGRLAAQLFRSLDVDAHLSGSRVEDAHLTLQLAALLHNVGGEQNERKRNKATGRLIRALLPPHGLDGEHTRFAALVARYHSGALPLPASRRVAGLTAGQYRLLLFLAGILRLAHAFDHAHDGHIRRLTARRKADVLVIEAEGCTQEDRIDSGIAGARQLLEIACGAPVWVENINS